MAGRAAQALSALAIALLALQVLQAVRPPLSSNFSSLSGDEYGLIVTESGVIDGGGRVLEGKGKAGILVKGASGVIIRNFTVKGFEYGVLVVDSSNVTVEVLTVVECRVGVGARRSSHIGVSGSRFQNCMVGVFLEGVEEFRVVNNSFEGCGLYVRDSRGGEVEGNTVNGKPLLYVEGAEGVEVGEPAGQVVLLRCKGVTVRNVGVANTTVGVLLSDCSDSRVVNASVSGCTVGIEVWRSRSVTVEASTVEGNRVGIRFVNSEEGGVADSFVASNGWGLLLNSSTALLVKDNIFDSNRVAALHFLNCSGVKVIGNVVWRNAYGVSLAQGSRENLFAGNDFVENAVHAVIENAGVNFWDDGSMGNFWSGSKVGEPYVIGEGNVDRRPLSSPTRLIPVEVSSPYGYVEGGGWYLKGSKAVVKVEPTHLLILRFSHWENEKGEVVSREPIIELVVHRPVKLRAVWSLDYPVIAALLLAASVLLVYLIHRRRS